MVCDGVSDYATDEDYDLMTGRSFDKLTDQQNKHNPYNISFLVSAGIKFRPWSIMMLEASVIILTRYIVHNSDSLHFLLRSNSNPKVASIVSPQK